MGNAPRICRPPLLTPLQDKTQKETREFLRQAIQEELENDPNCTFQPQLSEMSQLIMKKHSGMGFYDRMDMWATRKNEKMKQLSNIEREKEEYSFKPKIVSFSPPLLLLLLHPKFLPNSQNKSVPKFSTGKVYQNKGVKKYLERLQRVKQIEEMDRKRAQKKRPASNFI